jgi:hypothetical protein
MNLISWGLIIVVTLFTMWILWSAIKESKNLKGGK